MTVVQLRAVAVTPSPLPASLFHSFERATPSGCHAYSSRPLAANSSESAASDFSSLTSFGVGLAVQEADLVALGLGGDLAQRVAFDDRCQLVAGTDHDGHFEAELLGDHTLAVSGNLVGLLGARQHDVAALHVRADVLESGLLQDLA